MGIYLHDDFWIDMIWFFIFVICAIILAYTILKIIFARSNQKSDIELDAVTRAYLTLTMQERRWNENNRRYYFLEEISKAEYVENKRKIKIDLTQAETEYKQASKILHG